MLFGTLFKYMDKDKEDGGEKLETSKSKVDEGNDSQEESESKEEELKAGEPDLTTPPPPQEEIDTDDVPTST